MDIAERIDKAILDTGYTYRGVCRATGISFQTLYNYRTGKSQPNAYALIELCKLLGVSSDWILGLKERNDYEG